MKWIKPNGNEIETNDEPATIAAAKALKWKESKEKKTEKKDK